MPLSEVFHGLPLSKFGSDIVTATIPHEFIFNSDCYQLVTKCKNVETVAFDDDGVPLAALDMYFLLFFDCDVFPVL
jgi:hypothetical protein